MNCRLAFLEIMNEQYYAEELNRNRSCINELQKYHLCEYISAIYYHEFVQQEIEPLDTFNAFQAMLALQVSDDDKEKFATKGVWSSIEKVRETLHHPRPQEKLDLVKFNDKVAPAIKKEAVVYYLRELIEEKIATISQRQLTLGLK